MLRERIVLVATDATGIVGFGQLNQASGQVDAFYVRPGRQGEGLGRALLSALEGEARAAGLKELQLSAPLNAVGFYARAGYTGNGDHTIGLFQGMRQTS